MSQKMLFNPTSAPFQSAEVPEVIFDEAPELVELYNTAWRQAWAHVYESVHMPQSPYMGEGCGINKIWIWDTCFMAHYCRYAAGVFPGIVSLDNFYKIVYDRQPGSILIHILDNPPLFAWTEYQYFQLTGDVERLERILHKGKYLQKHYEWLETTQQIGEVLPSIEMPIQWKRLPNGYRWSGGQSGMDNTPRGRELFDHIFWLDALAQQGLSALYIARIAEILEDRECSEHFEREYEAKKVIMQKYWDEHDGAFYDLMFNGELCKVLTPAAFWPLLAEMASSEQAERMAGLLTDPQKLGGPVPCPSLSRDDPDFRDNGLYWRGGVWLPTTYMTVKALEKYGNHELATEISLKTLEHMSRTFHEFEPHTIWEAYSPTECKPATNSRDFGLCRRDFCGWSALGPISLFIENVIGLYKISARENLIRWRLTNSGRHGIKNLRFGNNTVSLLFTGSIIEVTTTHPFTLDVNGIVYECRDQDVIDMTPKQSETEKRDRLLELSPIPTRSPSITQM